MHFKTQFINYHTEIHSGRKSSLKYFPLFIVKFCIVADFAAVNVNDLLGAILFEKESAFSYFPSGS